MIILRRPGRSARVLLAAGLLALMASVAPTLAHAQTPDRSRLSTILLVRHAEKAGLSGNVPLNDAGRSRALRQDTPDEGSPQVWRMRP